VQKNPTNPNSNLSATLLFYHYFCLLRHKNTAKIGMWLRLIKSTIMSPLTGLFIPPNNTFCQINLTVQLPRFKTTNTEHKTKKQTSKHQSTSICNQSPSISHHSLLTTHLSVPPSLSPFVPQSPSPSVSHNQHPSSSSSSSGSGISIFCFLTCIVFFFA